MNEPLTANPKLVALVRGWLGEIPDLMVEVQHYVTPGSAPVDPDARQGSGVKSHRMVLVPDVVDLLDVREKNLDPDDVGWLNRIDGQRRVGVFPTLSMWVSLVHGEMIDLDEDPSDCCPPRAHTLAGEVAWLSQYADRAVALHNDFAPEMRQIRNDLRTACRVVEPFVPQCPKCGWWMEGQWPDDEVDAEKAPPWWKCSGCGWTITHDAEVRRLAALQPPMTLRQMATMTGVSHRTLLRWEADKRFLPVGENSRGVKLYEVDHIKRTVEKTDRAS